MRRSVFAAAMAGVIALALPAASADAQGARRAAAAQDWTRVAVRTPEGGFRMGNPAARTKVIEYLSLTCGHCAEFAREGYAGLLAAVRTGQVSIEYRNYVLNGLDVSAALLTRCASPVNYFRMTHELLTTQPSWMGRTRNVPPAQQQQLAALQPLQLAQRLVPILGLDAVAQRYGITAAMRQSCMSQAALNQVNQLREAGNRAGVQGTPTFFINGAIQNVNHWAGIQPLLQGR